MPFNFSDQEEEQLQDLGALPQPRRVQAEETSEDYAEVFSEAEKRFAKAQFYRQLLVESPFDDTDPIAAQVVEELRGFVRERLAVLLGVKTERPVVAASDFEPEEIEVLKKVAGRLLKKPEIAQIEAPKVPTMRKVASPEATKPSVKPVKPVEPTPAPKVGRPKKTQGQKNGEWIEVDGIRYDKVVDDPRGEHYTGPDGQKYVVMKNEANQMYMKNVTPVGVPSSFKPVPRLTSDMMAAISARQVQQAMKNPDVADLANITLVKG
jgi:hypothetical protein